MASTSPNQTISYLGRRFAERGVQLNKRHGQNFLIDANLLRLIVDRAQLGPNDVVLEVGTGTGALTALMAPLAAAIVTVEIDEQLQQLASEELFEFKNVMLVRGDALKSKSQLAEPLIAAVQKQLATGPDRRLKFVANLPYQVATPLVANLLGSSIVPHSMTITVQKEVAERMTASPGTSDYGALSVWIGSQCQVELVRTLPPSVFWPRPKVNSAIVHLEVDPALRSRIADLDFFHEFVRRLFMHRRKFLRSELVAMLKHRIDKAAVDEILAATGLDPSLRAEQLDVPTMLRLCEAVSSRLGGAFAA